MDLKKVLFQKTYTLEGDLKRIQRITGCSLEGNPFAHRGLSALQDVITAAGLKAEYEAWKEEAQCQSKEPEKKPAIKC